MAKAYKTTFQLVVYSPEPITTGPYLSPDNGEMYDPLQRVLYDITDGDKIGDWQVVSGDEPIEGDQLTLELVGIGNDGHFFDDFEDEDYTEIAPGISVPTRNVAQPEV